MEDSIGSYWSMKSHKNKTDEIVRLTTRVKTLENALKAIERETEFLVHAKTTVTIVYRIAKQALAATEPKA